jgi:ribonuclease P protein component
MLHQFSFSKKEHLCGETRINKLYTEGKAFIAYPLRVVYLFVETEDEVSKIMVNVPKKRFKRAVKRNRLKRLMREAYRLNKTQLINILSENNLNIYISFNYVSDEESDFATIEQKIKVALLKITEKINSKTLSDI